MKLPLKRLEVKQELVNGKVKHFIEVKENKFYVDKELQVEQISVLLEQVLSSEGEELLKIFQENEDLKDGNPIKVGLFVLKHRNLIYNILSLYFKVPREQITTLSIISLGNICFTLYMEYNDFFSEGK